MHVGPVDAIGAQMHGVLLANGKMRARVDVLRAFLLRRDRAQGVCGPAELFKLNLGSN